MKDYKNHPLSEILPPLTEREYESLKQDVLAHGFLEPITVYEGQILNGRALYRIAKELKLEPQFKTFISSEKVSAKDYVLSKIQGRQLSISQLACIAAEVNEIERRPLGEYTALTNEKKRSGTYVPKTKEECFVTRDLIADRFNVGRGTVSFAIALFKNDREGFDEVKGDKITVSSAYKRYVNTRKTTPPKHNAKTGNTISNIKKSLNSDLIVPSVFDSLEVIELFMKRMNDHGWIFELRVREGLYYGNFYGNGFPALVKGAAMDHIKPVHHYKHSVVTAGKERLDAAARLNLKKVA